MIGKQNKIEKPWGYEILWAQTDKYVGKVLFIKAGHRLSRQYHEVKEETIMVSSGTLLLEIGSNEQKREIILKRGGTYHVEPKEIHRFCALSTDVEIFEVSTPEINDIVRIEDDYKRTN